MNLYVSGKLKEKVANNCKEQTINIRDDGFDESKFLSIGYNGELSTSVFDEIALGKLQQRQEDYIRKGILNTRKLIKEKLILKTLINEIEALISKINKTERNVTCALFECLYFILYNTTSNGELLLKLIEFDRLITYINTLGYLDQTDLDLIIYLFKNGQKYDDEALKEEKLRRFKIYNEDEVSYEIRKIIKYGEFVSPNRVSDISLDLMREEEYSYVIALIYFALKDDNMARNFLILCQRPDLDGDIIRKNAALVRVPENLIELTRR